MFRRTQALCWLALLTMAALPAAAQQPQPDYTKPRSHFPNLFAPYMGRTTQKAAVANSSRVGQVLEDGKIHLSLSDAIALALENNLDLAIARYNLQIADTDILRTKAGATARGVASGLVQGTPGGGVGGFGTGAPGAGAGGTSGGAGGAGTGAGGLVQSTIGTGAPVESFDPNITSVAQVEHAAFPLSNTVTTGTALLQQNTATVNFDYTQAWATGTSLDVGINNSRQTTNSLFETLVPAITSSFRATIRQRLLSGFGLGPNTRFIRIAKNNREISDIAFRNQVIATVTQIQNIYWDLVNAAEELKVRQRSVALAEKTLEDNKKQAELQAIAPIEVMRAESELDARRQELITAETAFQLQQLLMKNAIMRDVSAPEIANAEVIPTDTMAIATTEPVVPTQDLMAEALSHRPELAQARIDLTNRQITRKAARNALLPTLDAVAFYGGTGQAGVQNPFLPAGVVDAPIAATGFTDAFRNSFNGSSPDYAVGIQMNIPLRNRAAQADQVRSELEYRQAELRYQQLQNQIRIEVQNAQFAVTQNRARVDSARKARDLAQRTYDIEQKKLALGASTGLALLQVGRDLAVAESNLVTAMTTYQKSRVELDRVVGSVLDHNGISMEDAETGRVNSTITIPGVVRTDK